MNFIKRAFLSVKARIGKTFLQLFIFTAICLLVISGLAIQTATNKAADIARQSLGAQVTFQPNIEKLMAQMRSGEGGLSGGERPTLEPVSIADVEELASYSQVLAYNLLNSTISVSATDFTAIELDESESNLPDGVQFNVATDDGEGSMGDLNFQGVLFSEIVSNFSDGNSKLIDGRHLTDADKDTNVAMIEQTLAEENGLSLGDIITVTVGELDYEFEIAGIYEATVSADDIMAPISTMLPYNQIYVPYTAVNEMSGIEENTVTSAAFILSDPALVNEFIEQAQDESSIDFEAFALDANNSQYEMMTSSINSVASFSKGIVHIVAIGGAAILGLMVMMAIRERKGEIGVLLALGESKGKLVGQFVTETLMIAVIALGISIAGGNVVASKISDQLLNNATEVQENQPMMMGGMVAIGGTTSVIGGGGAFDTITDLDVSVTGHDVAILAVIGLGIVIVSTAIPCTSILRLQPKTILTKQD